MSETEKRAEAHRWEEWIRSEDDPRGAFAKPEALDNLLVVDVSLESVAGMVCPAFLAELGAEVIKLEPPRGERSFGNWPGGPTR